MESVLGLVAAIAIWAGTMRVLVWSMNKQVSVVLASGLPVEDRYRHITLRKVARYHPLGWTVAILVFFVLLKLAAFPLWQLLGYAGLLSLVYGTYAVARGESEWIGKDDPERVALFGPLRDALWYRVLMVMEWVAYLAAIVFSADLLVGLAA
jgi:hypothetical protein